MKNTRLILNTLSILFLLASCGPSKKTKSVDEPVSDNISPQIDTIYQGGGNEPGWHVILTTNASSEIGYILILDYGEIQLSGIAESLPGANPNKATHYILHDDTKPLVLNISYGQCIDDGDQSFETSVTLSDNNFVLKGCGSFE